jgi:hypothetical protein
MNKIEAIQALSEGKTLTHHLFSEEEFVKLSNNKEYYEFEDGVIQSVEEFWETRKDDTWFHNWKIKN